MDHLYWKMQKGKFVCFLLLLFVVVVVVLLGNLLPHVSIQLLKFHGIAVQCIDYSPDDRLLLSIGELG